MDHDSMAADPDISLAPWDDATVEVLNGWQHSPLHPFTCMAARHDFPRGPRPALVACRDGFRCPDEECTYEQDWAFSHMTDPKALADMMAAHDEFWAGRPQV